MLSSSYILCASYLSATHLCRLMPLWQRLLLGSQHLHCFGLQHLPLQEAALLLGSKRMDTAQQQVLHALVRPMQDSQLQLHLLQMRNNLQICSSSSSSSSSRMGDTKYQGRLLAAVAAEGSGLRQAA
jgi:hypothetical protein